MSKTTGLLVVAVLFLGLFLRSASAQESDAARIAKVEGRADQLMSEVKAIENNVNALRASIRSEAGSGVAVFLFGVVCALWAQNSNRNPWLWFFLGPKQANINGYFYGLRGWRERADR